MQVLSTQGLSFQYPKGPLWNFKDLEIQAGEHWLIAGDSGSGKTTLMHLLTGLITPVSGSIYWGKEDISTLSSSELIAKRKDWFSVVLQQPELIPGLTLSENLELVQQWHQSHFSVEEIQKWASQLGIDHLLQQRANAMSIGQLQRAAVLKALAMRTSIIVLDEPTSALDTKSARDTMALILELSAANQQTVIAITHDERIQSQFNHKIELF